MISSYIWKSACKQTAVALETSYSSGTESRVWESCVVWWICTESVVDLLLILFKPTKPRKFLHGFFFEDGKSVERKQIMSA